MLAKGNKNAKSTIVVCLVGAVVLMGYGYMADDTNV